MEGGHRARLRVSQLPIAHAVLSSEYLEWPSMQTCVYTQRDILAGLVGQMSLGAGARCPVPGAEPALERSPRVLATGESGQRAGEAPSGPVSLGRVRGRNGLTRPAVPS